MKSKRRLLILAGLLLIVGMAVLLNPYPRQLLFGPRPGGIPLCVWQEGIRRECLRGRQQSYFARVFKWLGITEQRLVWSGVSIEERERIYLSLADDPDPEIRKEIARRLWHSHSKEAFAALVRLIDDESAAVREEAAINLDLMHRTPENRLEQIKAILDHADPRRRILAMHIIAGTYPSRQVRLDTLIRMLDDQDAKARAAAARLLASDYWKKRRMVKAALPKLKGLLLDMDALCRVEAAHALWHIQGNQPGVAAVFRKEMKNIDSEVRRAVVMPLRQMKTLCPEVWNELVLCAYEEQDAQVKRAAVLALGNCGRRAVPLLIDIVKNKDTTARHAALAALGEMGVEAREAGPFLLANVNKLGESALFVLSQAQVKDAVPLLLKLLVDPKGSSKDWLIGALGDIGPDAAAAVPTLIEVMNSKGDKILHSAAVVSLGKIGAAHPRVVPTLIELLNNEDEGERSYAAEGLRHVGPMAKDAIPLLLQKLRHPRPEYKSAYAMALGAMGSEAKAAVPELLRFLKSPPGRNPKTVTALGQIGFCNSAVCAALLPLLRDEDEQIRRSVVQALARFGPEAKDAIPALTTMLDDDDEELAEAAALALTAIDPARYPKK